MTNKKLRYVYTPIKDDYGNYFGIEDRKTDEELACTIYWHTSPRQQVAAKRDAVRIVAALNAYQPGQEATARPGRARYIYAPDREGCNDLFIVQDSKTGRDIRLHYPLGRRRRGEGRVQHRTAHRRTQRLPTCEKAEGLTMMTNQQRIARCLRAVHGYSDDTDLAASLTDFLADAMHLCQTRHLEFDRLIGTASMHFEAERGENRKELPAPFDDYEIHGVREFGKGKHRCCEPVPDDEAQFWSLYGHIPGQGLECIGDFKTRSLAEEVYARITGQRFAKSSPLEAGHD